jgi:hypothetical protein
MNSELTSPTALDVTVKGHHFHRTEHGMKSHHINGRSDHSAGGIMSTVEAFAEEITRLRQLVPAEAAHEESAPPLVDPMGSRPSE